MSLSTFLALLTATIVISLTPGAGAVNTMTNSISQGWRRSFWGILGQQIALIIQVVIVAIGVGALVAASPAVLTVIRWLGAAYLVYLGVRMLLAKPTVPDAPAHEEFDAAAPTSGAKGHVPGGRAGAGTRESAWSMIRRGTLVNLLNPKAIVFFLAFIPPFIRADLPQFPQYLIIAVTCVVVDVIVMWFGFAALARPLGRLMHTTRGQRILNTIFGCCFLLVAALLLLIH
ncbi:lysine transporter LysE [Galactobacter valiniphilus]|uniref:Lysine transporter LysE n=1 Tax=Galactobacter valiniphilus TaxID=2676122 RepID=A0A399JGL4_9MICC|nr:LysE family transporter [Galactobacter valiniphilus]RII43827.1 lysine transporter LysE [Galactobacter valiniphilus]